MLINSTKVPQREGSIFAILLLWVTALLLVTQVSPIYQVDEFTFLFLVLLKEMRTLGELKVLSFLVLVQIKGIRVNPEVENISSDLLRVRWCNLVCGVFVDDKTCVGWFLFYWRLMRLCVQNLRTLGQFQEIEMSLGVFEDFMDEYIKP